MTYKKELGEVVKTFTTNVSNKEQIKRLIKCFNNLQTVSQKCLEDEEGIGELEAIEKDIVIAILGASAWVELWAICANNVFTMLSFVKYLSAFLNEELQARVEAWETLIQTE